MGLDGIALGLVAVGHDVHVGQVGEINAQLHPDGPEILVRLLHKGVDGAHKNAR